MSQPRRPRRTKAAVDGAIHAAVLAELAEVGYAGLTLEGVARRAEISKPVLYRRHASRVSLVLATLASTIEENFASPPDTGSIRSDLLAWRKLANTKQQEIHTATLRGLVGEANDEQMQQIYGAMNARVLDMERLVLEPARARGELVGDIPPAVARLFFLLIRDDALFGTQDGLDPAALVDDIILPLIQTHSSASSSSAGATVPSPEWKP